MFFLCYSITGHENPQEIFPYGDPPAPHWKIRQIDLPPPLENPIPSVWGVGVTIGKYFQRVLVTRKRVTKKKHKNLPRQFICEDIKHDES